VRKTEIFKGEKNKNTGRKKGYNDRNGIRSKRKRWTGVGIKKIERGEKYKVNQGGRT